MNKKGISKLILTIIMAFAIIALLPIESNAGSFTLNTNDAWVSGSLTAKGQVDFYTINVPSSGWLTVKYQALSVKDCNFKLLNIDQTKEYWSHTLYSASDINPKTDSKKIAVNPGKYILRVKANSNYTGDYKVGASFQSAGSNDSLNNDSFQTAQTLTEGKAVTGFLSVDDRVDFYKITVNKNTTVKVNLTSYMDDDTKIMAYDKDMVSYFSDHIWYTSSTSPKTKVYEIALKKGVNYIKIYPDYGDTGKYIIKFSKKILVNKITIKGQKKVTCGKTANYKRVIAPANAADKSVRWSLSKSNMGYINSETGKFTAYRPGKVKIIATAKDGSGKKGTYVITIAPKKMYSPSGYRSSSTGKPHFYWTTQSYVSGYELQITQGSFANAKTIRITNPKKSSIDLSYISKGKYKIRIRSYIKVNGKKVYGVWSNPGTATIPPRR